MGERIGSLYGVLYIAYWNRMCSSAHNVLKACWKASDVEKACKLFERWKKMSESEQLQELGLHLNRQSKGDLIKRYNPFLHGEGVLMFFSSVGKAARMSSYQFERGVLLWFCLAVVTTCWSKLPREVMEDLVREHQPWAALQRKGSQVWQQGR